MKDQLCIYLLCCSVCLSCFSISGASQDVNLLPDKKRHNLDIDSLLELDPEKALHQAIYQQSVAKEASDNSWMATAAAEKAKVLNSLGRKEESAFAYLECTRMLQLNEDGDPELIEKCFQYAAMRYRELGLFELSKELAFKSLNYSNRISPNTRVIRNYALLAEIFFRQGNYEQALIYYDSCYQKDLALNDTINMAGGLAMLGRMNSRLGRKEKSLAFLKEGISLLNKEEHPFAYSIALNAHGLAHSNFNDFDKANEYFTKALHVGEEIRDTFLIINRNINLGNLHTTFKKYDSAEQYLLRSLDLMNDEFEPNRLVIIYENLAELNRAKRQYTKAIEYNEKALNIAKRGNMLPEMKKIFFSFTKIYEDQLDYKQAFLYQEQHQKISDSIFHVNAAIKNNALNYRYEASRKEAKIKELQYQNDFQTERLTTLKVQRLWLITTIALLTALGFLFYRYNIQRQQHKLQSKELAINKQLYIISGLQKDIAVALDQKKNRPSDLSLEEINKIIPSPLNQREYEIVEHVLKGLNNKQIAEQVFLSVNTVKFHLKKIYTKLDVSNRLEVMQLLLNK